jgi:hypothetical protein
MGVDVNRCSDRVLEEAVKAVNLTATKRAVDRNIFLILKSILVWRGGGYKK